MSGIMLTIGAVNADVYIDEDFESYANTAEMQAVWGAVGLGSLSTTFGFSGTQSMLHPGGTDNTFALAADLIPTDANPVVLRGKMYDDGASNKRFTIGMRSLSTFPLFEMGRYNYPILGEDYYVRINSFPGLSPDYVPLGLGGGKTGWHTFEATFTGSDITISVDLYTDSVTDANMVFALGGAYATQGLGVVRLGGPSNLSSPGGGGYYEDIYLAQIPEPKSLALLGLSVIGVSLVRRLIL